MCWIAQPMSPLLPSTLPLLPPGVKSTITAAAGVFSPAHGGPHNAAVSYHGTILVVQHSS